MENEKKQLSQEKKEKRKDYDAVYYSRPEVKERKRKIYLEKCKDPEYRKKINKKHNDRYHNDKDFREKMKSKYKNLYRNSEEYREKIRAINKKYYLKNKEFFCSEKYLKGKQAYSREYYYNNKEKHSILTIRDEEDIERASIRAREIYYRIYKHYPKEI